MCMCVYARVFLCVHVFRLVLGVREWRVCEHERAMKRVPTAKYMTGYLCAFVRVFGYVWVPWMCVRAKGREREREGEREKAIFSFLNPLFSVHLNVMSSANLIVTGAEMKHVDATLTASHSIPSFICCFFIELG